MGTPRSHPSPSSNDRRTAARQRLRLRGWLVGHLCIQNPYSVPIQLGIVGSKLHGEAAAVRQSSAGGHWKSESPRSAHLIELGARQAEPFTVDQLVIGTE